LTYSNNTRARVIERHGDVDFVVRFDAKGHGRADGHRVVSRGKICLMSFLMIIGEGWSLEEICIWGLELEALMGFLVKTESHSNNLMKRSPSNSFLFIKPTKRNLPYLKCFITAAFGRPVVPLV
jgi:hypothetical protein